MRKRHKFEVNGCEYDIEQMGGLKSIKVFHRIMRAVGPAIGKMDPNQNLKNVDISSFGNAIEAALENFDEDQTERLIRDVFTGGTVQTETRLAPIMDVFDTHFAGNTMALLKVLKESLAFNYSDFLGDALAHLSEARANKSEGKG